MDETQAQAIDTQLAGLWEKEERAKALLRDAIDRIHSAVRDTHIRHGRVQSWKLSHEEAFAKAHQIAGEGGHGWFGIDIPETFNLINAQRALIGSLQSQSNTLEAIWREHRWTRYFPCRNSNGHIHATLRECPTVRWDTPMGWFPSLSGKPVEVAVQMPPAGLGPALCSVCFPGAPVEHRSQTLGDVERERTRAERQAAKDTRDAEKARKRLAADEVFPTEDGHDTVETVAACKSLIGKPIITTAELAWYRSPAALATPGWDAESLARVAGNIAGHLIQQTADAQHAERLLLAREAAHEGWGATQAEIARIRASAARRAAKDWAT